MATLFLIYDLVSDFIKMSKQSPRKGIKVACQECGSQFDYEDDYKSRHEKYKNNGQYVRVKHVGAPINPFKAFKRERQLSSFDHSSTFS